MDLKSAIDIAGELDAKIKSLETELKWHKEFISQQTKDYRESCVVSGEKFVLSLSFVEKRVDADPEQTLEYMTKKGIGDKFFDVVKVQAKDLEKVIGKHNSDSLRPITGVTPRMSFSKTKN